MDEPNKALDKVEARAADRTARNDEAFRRRRLKRADNLDDVTVREQIRERKSAARSARAAARWLRVRKLSAAAVRQFMVCGPIVAPMSVAWTGQGRFAMAVLGWAFLGGVLYAAAYELTTVFCAWMYHEARKDGDKGWEYRIATWLFALGSAAQQWWHYSDNWNATPRAVTYSTMTLVGLAVWELYARLVHRRKLRSDGRIGGVRPRLGLVRWVRYPGLSWSAWSLSILHGYSTLEQAWSAAERARSAEDAAVRPEVRVDRPVEHAIRADLPGPRVDGPAQHRRGPDLAGPRELEAAEVRPEVRTASTEVRKVEAEVRPKEPEVRTAPVQPSQAPAADGFEPTDLERQVVREMVEREIRLNRKNVADYVRNEKGSSIATTRAGQLAAWGRDNGGTYPKAV